MPNRPFPTDPPRAQDLPVGFLPRVGPRSYRPIEKSIAPPTFFSAGVRLTGAVVEASWAADDPPLLDRLRRDRVPFLVDTESLRYTDEAFLTVRRLRESPFAPTAPVTPASGSGAVQSFVAPSLEFQAAAGASAYLSPGVPFGDLHEWWELEQRLLRAATASVGVDVPSAPLIAVVAPAGRMLKRPTQIAGQLVDLPLAGVYVQPPRLLPTKDSIEKLVAHVTFLQTLSAVGLHVTAGRVGAFGLVLAAMGLDGFDSGLANAEQYDLAGLHSQARRTGRERQAGERSEGGPARRLYLEALKTTLPSKLAAPVLSKDSGLRGRFACTHGCCAIDGFERLPDRSREHYLHVRSAEVDQLRKLPTQNLRTAVVERDLRAAAANAGAALRVLEAAGAQRPSFDHLQRWIAVLNRLATVSAAA